MQIFENKLAPTGAVQVVILKIVMTIVLLFGAGVFVWTRNAEEQESFRREFRNASIQDRRKIVEHYFETLGPKTLLDIVEETYPLCHNEGHDLGKVIFAHTKDLLDAISLCRNGCSGGCFHGILTEAFRNPPSEISRQEDDHVNFEDIKPKIKEMCDDPAVLAFHKKGKCVHGMGHVLAYLTDYNLEEALQACKLFGSKPLEFYCQGGAYMEYDMQYGEETWTQGPIHSPCDTAEFPAACYRYKGKHILQALGSVAEFAKACMTIDGFSRWGCFQGLGFTMLNDIAESPGTLGSICAFGDLKDKTMCIQGAIERLADEDESLTLRACVTLPDDEKPICDHAVKTRYYNLEKSFDLYFREGD